MNLLVCSFSTNHASMTYTSIHFTVYVDSYLKEMTNGACSIQFTWIEDHKWKCMAVEAQVAAAAADQFAYWWAAAAGGAEEEEEMGRERRQAPSWRRVRP